MSVKRKIKEAGKKLLGRDNRKEIIQFKKDIWQTEEISRAFIKGTDSSNIAGASVMDKEVNEYFLAGCRATDKVLDIGCGHGIVSEHLAENKISVAAVDISEKLLEEFKARIAGRNLPIEIKKGDAYNIPYPDNTFDVVVARMFLPHFPNWSVVLKEMTRVTKTGGKLMVHFSSAENTSLGKRIGRADCSFASSPDSSNPWNFYAETDDRELQKVSRETGLELVNRTPVGFFQHNRIIGYQLGANAYNSYMEKIEEFFQDEKVKAFAVWFDKEVIAKCTPALSHFNIITFKKIK